MISRGVSGSLLFEGGAAGVFWFAKVMLMLVGRWVSVDLAGQWMLVV